MEWIHIKTGNKYTVIDKLVKNATNGHEDDPYFVLYKDGIGQLFVREYKEFHERFTLLEPPNKK